jgi:ATP-dependent DNA helicase RecG
LAPVFKRLGIIEQWGNGLKLIKEELQAYPEIELSWKEPGIAFRVTFTNKHYQQQQELQQEFKEELSALGTKLGLSWHQAGTKLAPSWHQVGTKSAPSWNQIMSILEFCIKPKTIQEIMQKEEWKDRTKFRNKYIKPFLDLKLLSMTIPDKPNSSKQQYQITERGEVFLQFLNQKNKHL